MGKLLPKFRNANFSGAGELNPLMNDLNYEISVLSPFIHVMNIKEIEIGKHGLLIKKGHREGLLLPQVATEQGWDLNTFLQHTCLKAGLPNNT